LKKQDEKQYLEAGKIVNTHGVKGEVKILPWADSAAFLQDFDTFYIDGKPVQLISSRVHKQCLIARLEGVDDVPAAMLLKNKIIHIRRDEALLPPGHFFVQDAIGLSVVDEDGDVVGILKEILPLPGGDVYVVTRADGGGEYLIPNVDAFILEKNLDEGFIRVRLIEGM